RSLLRKCFGGSAPTPPPTSAAPSSISHNRPLFRQACQIAVARLICFPLGSVPYCGNSSSMARTVRIGRIYARLIRSTVWASAMLQTPKPYDEVGTRQEPMSLVARVGNRVATRRQVGATQVQPDAAALGPPGEEKLEQ